MQTKPCLLIFCFFTFCLASSVIAQESSLQELQQRCEQARENKIAPLRQAAIEECITSNPRRRNADEFCERFYSDFGQGGRTASGGFRQRMFHDLPECLEFYQAERQSRDNSRAR